MKRQIWRLSLENVVPFAKPEEKVLVLQGGGALGAYQAGAYLTLAEAGMGVDWIAGISIGAIHAAILAGNPPEDHERKLRAFWELVTDDVVTFPGSDGPMFRALTNEISAAKAATLGIEGFFRPRGPFELLNELFSADFWKGPTSFYDTSPLRQTLLDLADFDYLNEKGPRVSVGAVEVESGNFAYFDSRHQTIAPEHIMASAALPPGLPSVEIDGVHYWDGGMVSNTPLQYVLEEPGDHPLLVFQIDLFSARGHMPKSLLEVQQRDKDIRLSSRTRLTTDRYLQLHDIAGHAARLREKLPPELRDDSDMVALYNAGPHRPVTLVLLINRPGEFDSGTKDYQFSRLTMTERWKAGQEDAARTLANPLWTGRELNRSGIHILDLAAPEGGIGPHYSKVSAL